MAATGGKFTGGAASLRKGARPVLLLFLTSLVALLALTPLDAAASPGWAQILNRPTPDFGSIDFVSETEGWLAAGAGLLHTTDRGATWTEAAQLSGYDVDFADAQHGWLVGVSGAIYGTADGGDTWTRQESGTQVHLSDVFARGPQEAWVVGSWEGFSDALSYPIPTAFLHTTDGGTTWERIETPPNTWFEMVTFVGDAGWVWGQGCQPIGPDSSPCSGGGLSSTLLRTTDGGETWALTDVTSPSGANNMVFVNEDNGWIAGADCPPNFIGSCVNNIYATVDGGLTWQVIPASAGWLVRGLALQDTMTGWAVRHDCQYPVCSLSLMSTPDGGATWSASPIAEAQDSATALAVMNDAFYVVGRGLAQRSIDGGTTWDPMRHPAITFDDFAFVDRRTGYALSDGALLRSADGGRSWSAMGPTPSATRWIEFPTANVGFTTAGTCQQVVSECTVTVYGTRDGGESWTAVDTRSGGSSAGANLRFRTADFGWYVLNETTLALTEDGGETWAARDISAGGNAAEVDVVDESDAWAIKSVAPPGGGSTHYEVMHSTDGGATWQPSGTPDTTYAQHLQFVDQQHGWYVKSGCDEICTAAIAITEDGGESWEEVELDDHFGVQDMVFVDPLNGWVSSRECEETCTAAIWHSPDGGRSWELQSEGEHQWGVLAAVDESAAWLASEHPMGIGGAPPSRTYLYQISGPEQTIQFPITGRRGVRSSALLPIVTLGLLGGALVAGALGIGRRRA